MQVGLGLIAMFAAVAIAAYFFRSQLTSVGNSFVRRFGVVGMAFGTLLADGFQFPVPPQFYMLAAITHEGSDVAALVAISIGSVCGGAAGYALGYRGAALSFVSRRLERPRAAVVSLLAKRRITSLVLISVSPIPFSIACYALGLVRLPSRVFAIFLVLRVPRLLIIYWFIRAAWLVSGRGEARI